MPKTKAMEKSLLDLAVRLEKDQSHWRENYANLSPSVKTLWDHYRAATGAMYATGREYAEKLRITRENDLIPETGRQRLLFDQTREVKERLDEQERAARAAVVGLRGFLTDMALPRVSADREMPARDELRMLVQGSGDPVQTLFEVAQRHDELASVATSSFGESLLRATGVKDAKQHHVNIRSVALAVNVDHPDPTVASAAQAHRDLEGDIESSVTGVRTWVKFENELEG